MCFVGAGARENAQQSSVQKCASWSAWKYVCVSVCGASFVREKHVCGVRDGMRMHGGQVL